MNLKNTLLSLIAAGTFFLAPKLAEGINVQGHFDEPSCSVKVWRVNPADTIFKETNIFGKWAIETNNFNPPSQIEDSLYIEGGWNLGGNAKTSWVQGPVGENEVYDLNLDKHTGCIDEIIDTSGLHDSIPLMCEYWISGFDHDTTQVDTGFNWYWYYDLHIPFDTLQAQQGAMAHYKLFKKVIDSPDTLYVKEDSFLINKDAFDGQLIRENDTFPKEKIIIGIEEQKQKNIESNFQVMPTITNGNVKIYGINAFSVYNSAGQKVDKKENNSGTYFINGPEGIYFLKPEESELPVKKVIKKK